MSAKRQELVDTAIRLFAQHGYHGTGIDRIAAEAKISKKTMYNHFRSKEELIVAVLKDYEGLLTQQLVEVVDGLDGTPADKLIGIFDVARGWFEADGFYGCMAINAIGEYSQSDGAIRQACQDFKGVVRAYIQRLAEGARAANPQELAESLCLLLEGAIVTAQVAGNPESAEQAKRAARVLIEAALR